MAFTLPTTWESNSLADKLCQEAFIKVEGSKSKKKQHKEKRNANANLKKNIRKLSKDKTTKDHLKAKKKEIYREIKTASIDVLKFETKRDLKNNLDVKSSKQTKKRKKTKAKKIDNNELQNSSVNKRNINCIKNKPIYRELGKTKSNDMDFDKSLLINKAESQRTKTLVKKQKLIESLNRKTEETDILKKPLTLRQKMMVKLKAARFRFLNEQIYTATSNEAQKIFNADPDAYLAYHEGYRQQVKRWPINPVDVIIKIIKKMPKEYVIADFGCGEAKLAKSVNQKVHSFDLIAANELVTACDMAHVPLEKQSVDVVVFCLSLMGTNMQDYILEATRVLKIGGLLKIAEVESRFDNVEQFVQKLQSLGFKKTRMDLSNNLFYFIDFKKQTEIKNKKKLPKITLQPCMYKKR